MKKPLLLLTVLTVLLSLSTFAQSTKYGWLAKESWGLGFGYTYPKYVSNSGGIFYEGGYGGFLSIQRNYSEHIAFRIEANYLLLQTGKPSIKHSQIGANLDLLYYFVPCEPISPYLGVGLGAYWYDISSNGTLPVPAATLFPNGFLDHIDYQMNVRFGSEFRIGENWRLKTELGYHSAASSKFDGTYGTYSGGLLGGATDTYMTFDLGVIYYFGYGEKSHICEMYEGINVDYDRIEDMIKKYAVQPSEVDYNRIEDIVKRNQIQQTSAGAPLDNWVLIGINFDFNKSSIKSESIPILYNAAEILLKNPDIKVEIQGHTDNVGSDNYNQKLSLRRAETVRNFLIAKGVAASRLTTVGMGETKPIMDNKNAEGRGLNRRIEFKVVK